MVTYFLLKTEKNISDSLLLKVLYFWSLGVNFFIINIFSQGLCLMCVRFCFDFGLAYFLFL